MEYDKQEDFYCADCHGEFVLLIDPDVTSITDIKCCVFCGEELDKELNLRDDDYEEGWDNE